MYTAVTPTDQHHQHAHQSSHAKHTTRRIRRRISSVVLC
jgi:hypothetical protein